MSRLNHLLSVTILLASWYTLPALADINTDIDALQSRWAEVNYQLTGKAQTEAFAALASRADAVTTSNPESAAAWIWSGIIKSTYAGAKGGLGALGIAKQARADLERAMELDDTSLEGSVYTSLGTLYFSVPGWPVGFGDEKQAEALLGKALELSPQGIDSNYFYAEFKRKQKDYGTAREYYLKAQAAPARPGREVADSGRQKEIAAALKAIQDKS